MIYSNERGLYIDGVKWWSDCIYGVMRNPSEHLEKLFRIQRDGAGWRLVPVVAEVTLRREEER